MKQVSRILSLCVVVFALNGCGYDKATEEAPYVESLSNRTVQSGDEYNEIVENSFVNTKDQPVSTFSIDADGGSYANVRRYINEGALPPPDAVRIEELLNYFNYDYSEPSGSDPLNIDIEAASTPWSQNTRLVRIGLKGKTIPDNDIPSANFVFLIDVSGSMSSGDKLGLVKYGLSKMVDALDENDRIGLVTYASSPGVALESTSCKEKDKITSAISDLSAGGATNGEGGIHAAYKLAEENFIEGGNNRIILCTDGDFNVGTSSQNELVKLIEKKRESGVFLTVVGMGHGNLKDGTMEQLANSGNGTYEYLDSREQARRVFVANLSRMIYVAKDVKVQVEFNPTVVESYRLIGYENRVFNNQDFEDDSKDAGELGSGQTVTALYEVKMVENIAKKEPSFSFRFRYKEPDGEESKLIEVNFEDNGQNFSASSEDFQFAAAVSSFGMLLRDSKYAGTATYDQVKDWAMNAVSFNPEGERTEFIDLVGKAKELK